MILVSDRWKIPVIGSPMYILQIKLKNLKKVLIKWNKEVFGDIVTNAHIANTEVEWIQQLLDSNYSDDL